MKQMGVREFLRGGYRTLSEPTLVSKHNRILFTVMPHSEEQFLSAMIKKTEPAKSVSDARNR